MKSKYLIYLILPTLIVIGHIFLLPFIFKPEWFGFVPRLNPQNQIDIALIIAPLTSASVVSATKFAVENRAIPIGQLPEIKNALFPLVATIFTVAFFSAIYLFLGYFYQTPGLDAGTLKGFVGVIEIFLGASYALVSSALFSR